MAYFLALLTYGERLGNVMGNESYGERFWGTDFSVPHNLFLGYQ